MIRLSDALSDALSEILDVMADDNSMTKEVIEEGLKKRILIINEDISGNVIEDYCMRILYWNSEDRDLPKESRRPIKIYINSTGGSAIDGFALVDVIQQSKTPVIGIVMGMAASMAFYIFLGCHKRIAFSNSVLLKHDGETTIQNSSSKAKDTMKFCEEMDSRIKDFVLSHSTMDEDFYDKTYTQEYWMYADEAKDLGCIDAIVGDGCDVDSLL